MPNRKYAYVDMEKYRRTRKAQKKRNYDKTATYCSIKWTREEEELVFRHEITDFELSKIIGHSVMAIQKRRWELKNAMKNKEAK